MSFEESRRYRFEQVLNVEDIKSCYCSLEIESGWCGLNEPLRPCYFRIDMKIWATIRGELDENIRPLNASIYYYEEWSNEWRELDLTEEEKELLVQFANSIFDAEIEKLQEEGGQRCVSSLPS